MNIYGIPDAMTALEEIGHTISPPERYSSHYAG